MINKKIRQEINSHKLVYLILLVVLVFAVIFRVYRVDKLLGFYYDQGRDALIIRDLLSLKNIPAIGPTTGISGIFLGPSWYYLLAIPYFIGGGSPIVPAIFVGLLDVAAVFFIYIFCKEFFDRQVGLIAAFIWGFSYYLVRLVRWFNNPSPFPLVGILFIYALARFFIKKEPKYIILASVCLAIGLQLEIISGALFIVPLVAGWVIFRPKIGSKKNILIATGLFTLFLLPQVVFDIKNNFLITKTFFGFITGKVNTDTSRTLAIPTFEFVKNRILSYYSMFFQKLETNESWVLRIFACFFLPMTAGFIFLNRNKNNTFSRTFLLLAISLIFPLIILLFYAGNYGRLYDYHLIGLVIPFVIIFAVLVSVTLRKIVYLPVFIFIMLWFIRGNLPFMRNYLIAGFDGPQHITLGNQLQAVDWIYENAGDSQFNVDVYVPPVIPYSYNYLFWWRGKSRYMRQPIEKNVVLLYTLSEVDTEYSFRLDAWLARQDGIGKVDEYKKFGGVLVERRERIIADKKTP